MNERQRSAPDTPARSDHASDSAANGEVVPTTPAETSSATREADRIEQHQRPAGDAQAMHAERPQEGDPDRVTREEPTASPGRATGGGVGEPRAAAGEVDPQHRTREGATAEHPLGADGEFLQPAKEGSLRDQGPLLDAEGEDIRMYTGEPVETDEGWVLPQQQNAGLGNIAGGGEWPDPDTPPAQPKSSPRGDTD